MPCTWRQSQALNTQLSILSLVPGSNHLPYTITAPLRSTHPLLPMWSWWSYSTIQYPSLPDQVAHVGKVVCLRPQAAAVSWTRTPAISVTAEHSAARLPSPPPPTSVSPSLCISRSRPWLFRSRRFRPWLSACCWRCCLRLTCSLVWRGVYSS